MMLESIMARDMRGGDVIVCNYCWMSNHPHIQMYSLDTIALTRFHGELKKRSSRFLKRLLGLSSLKLWDNRTTVAEVLDVESAIERLVYTFLNPVRAGLVRSIDHYTGLNTWKEFISAPASVDAVCEKEVPWIREADLEPLSCSNPSLGEERQLINELSALKRTHTLKVYPFKWLEAFGVRDPKEIEKIRQKVIRKVREGERKLAPKKDPIQRVEGYIVTDEYIPSKKERKIFMYGSTKEIRCAYLETFKFFLRSCVRCYELMKQGHASIPWPPECFVPSAPKLMNCF